MISHSRRRTMSSGRDNVCYLRNGQNSRLYKVIVIGEVHTGKSSIINRYVHDFFGENYRSTLGVDFKLKIIPYNDELEIRLQLWDVAGQERFTNLTRAYYKGAMGALIVFDQTSPQSFEAVTRWKKDLDEKCTLPGGPIPTVLVCNKADLPRHKRMPSDLEISEYVQANGFVPKWYRTSAKSGEGIDDALNVLLRYIMAIDTWSVPLRDPDADEAMFRRRRRENPVKLPPAKEDEKMVKKGCEC